MGRFLTLLALAYLLTDPWFTPASDEGTARKPGVKSAPAVAPAAKEDKDGLKALQGTWLIVAYAAKGDPIKPARDDDEPWVIKGDKLTYFSSVARNKIKMVADLKVDSRKQPAHIDFAQKGKWKGKEREWTTYGVYSLKGDELTVCIPEKFDPWEPENRPTEFKSTSPPQGKGSGFAVYVLKKK